ncbi:fasciclin domain-containing protein [Pedobacter nutrimenti]|uniref:fasciclin domain-containing protein n=1 Tax=Pedobacter nutrimenti TaxID=1241337 RepID=UPI00292F9169|nr:fasciclin domain-containing protein [Pedobacter nutrimenti]
MEIKNIKRQLLLLVTIAATLTACHKDSGFYEHEALNPKVSVNTYDYLKSKKGIFDSLIVAVDRLGLQTTLQDSNITVFAATNASFSVAIDNLNAARKAAGKSPLNLSNMDYIQLDTIMTQYVIRGKYTTDAMNRQDGVLLKGVRYGYQMNAQLNPTTTSGFQKGGPVIINYSDTKWSQFQQNWSTSATSSVNVLTKNGVVHTLNQDHIVGFRDFVIRFTLTFPPKNYIKLYGGILTVSSEAPSSAYPETSYYMLDESSNTKFFNGNALATKPFWMNIEFPIARVCNSYALTSANDNPGRDPKDWNMQGSQDLVNWEPLQTITGQSFPERFMQRVYRFDNKKAYKYYRLNITANNGRGIELQIADYMLGFK